MKQTIVTGASAASFSQADWLSPPARRSQIVSAISAL
jgi:hypothetical protein